MESQIIHRSKWAVSTALIIISTISGCASPATAPTTQVAAPSSTPMMALSSPMATSDSMSTPTTSMDMATPTTSMDMVMPTSIPMSTSQTGSQKVLYQDDFTDSSSGWPQDTFDNYFIGYHEPQWYFVQITSPNYKAPVITEPKRVSYQDTTVELQVFTDTANTAPTGDFRYGLVFRRSGDQWYAFAISPRTKKWYMLKSSSNGLVTLKEGVEDSIEGLNNKVDLLRVDVMGSNFSLHINDHLVGQVSDSDYAKGEIGLYAESFDSTQTRIHFDALSILEAPSQEADMGVLYQDDFTNPASGWPVDKKFDNYFLGYHEPEYYHVEISSPNYKTTVFAPNKKIFDDFSMEVKVFTVSKKTAATGDFAYGPAFRRSGDNYYTFTISPRTKKWTFLKSSPSALKVLAEGTEASINNLDTADVLRVDAQGSKFFLHINDQLIGQVTDSDYASGEVGFFVQTFDATNVHVHYDSIAVKDFTAPQLCNVNALNLNVRSGPGTSFASSEHLAKGDTIVPIGRSADGTWLQVQLENSTAPGWVYNSKEFVSCSLDVQLLPVVNP
jgi:SH3 domain-containing protein